MFLSVQELERKPIRYDVEFRPGEIDFEDPKVRQVAPFHTEGMAELLSNTLGEIRVRGKVAGEMETECDRCLEPVRIPVSSSYDLFYRPAEDVQGGAERAIDEGEAQIGFYEDDGIELAEVLREHVLLSLPMQTICSEACRGFCPRCGLNRNTGACSCVDQQVDDRWAALRQFKV